MAKISINFNTGETTSSNKGQLNSSISSFSDELKFGCKNSRLLRLNLNGQATYSNNYNYKSENKDNTHACPPKCVCGNRT